MKPILLLLTALFFLSTARLQAQHIFPKQYNDCVTDHFALESDTTNAKMDKKELARVLMSGWDETTVKKIRGMPVQKTRRGSETFRRKCLQGRGARIEGLILCMFLFFLYL